MRNEVSKNNAYFSLFMTIFWVGIIALSGCPQARGLPDRHIHRDVDSSEIIGTWQATDASIERITHEGYSLYTNQKNHCFKLFEDGTCEFSGYPFYSYPNIVDQKNDYMDSVTGQWTITKISTSAGHHSVTVPALQIVIETKKEIITHSVTIHLFIVEEKNHIVLWEYIGDPDYVKYMDFVKVPQKL